MWLESNNSTDARRASDAFGVEIRISIPSFTGYTQDATKPLAPFTSTKHTRQEPVDVSLDENIKHIFQSLGFPEPNPVPLMCIAHQIAQKLHGVTDVKSVRTQDLIDLQLIMAHETVDLFEVRKICERLFANRKAQAWPPSFAVTEEWKIGYEKMKGGLAVLSSCEDAAKWLKELILKISQTV